MKQAIGSILSIGGFIALVYTGINYINNSESFGFLGADVVVSKGDPVPLIISAVIMILGLLLLRTRN